VKYLICLVFLLWTGFAQADDFKYMHYLAGIDRQELLEPSIDKMVEWIPEEVPRTVSFYFDTNDDGMVDIIIAYHLIEAYACKEHCKVEVTTFNDHWVLVSSIGSNPYSYFIIKKWSLWRHTVNEDWQSVKKTSENVYKYNKYEDWYNEKFLELWPDSAP